MALSQAYDDFEVYRPVYTINIDSSALAQPANQMTVNYYSNPINLTGPYDVIVSGYTLWNTGSNISAALGNNTILVNNSKGTPNWKTITFPDGNYQISDLAAQIQARLSGEYPGDSSQGTPFNPAAPQIVLIPVPYLFTTEFTIYTDDVDDNNNWEVDLSVGTLYEVIGFNSGLLTPQVSDPTLPGYYGVFTGQNQADITNGVTSFIIQAPGVVNPAASYNSKGQSSILLEDTFYVGPGYRQRYKAQTLEGALPVASNNIKNFNIFITDQRGNPLDFGQGGNYNNNAFTLEMKLMPRKSTSDNFRRLQIT